MKDKDRKRFLGSMTWFNQFFEGLRQIYHHVASLMPGELLPEGFSINAENLYYPALKAAPSIPPYYALLMPGRQVSFQVVSIIDASLFSHNSQFHLEPSMLVVAHSRPDKFAWVDEFAMKVIKAEDLEETRKEREVIWGKINGKYPADFFAFQVQYDLFSDIRNPPEAVDQWIITPLRVNLAKGFGQPADTTSQTTTQDTPADYDSSNLPSA